MVFTVGEDQFGEFSYGFVHGASLVGAYLPCSLRVSSSRLDVVGCSQGVDL